jgi:hypothetical protein
MARRKILRMKKLGRTGLAVALASFAVSCMSQEEMSSIEGAVSRFHGQQAAKSDAEAYRETDDLFRDTTSLENFTRLNDAVRLAAVECQAPERNRNAWNVNQSTSGHFITVSYQRTCTSGPLTETFTFRMGGRTPKMVGYNISGMPLLPASQTAPATAPQNEPPPQGDDAKPQAVAQPA